MIYFYVSPLILLVTFLGHPAYHVWALKRMKWYFLRWKVRILRLGNDGGRLTTSHCK